MEKQFKDPWLVAAWPGMGAVAVLAAETLINGLGAERLGSPALGAWFDVPRVTVAEGMIKPAQRPQGFLFGWKNPDPDGHDLLIFLAEAQPEARQWPYCEELLSQVLSKFQTIRRVVTFAAMASPSEPRDPSRVFAAATKRTLLDPLGDAVVRMKEGEIAGLNGILVAAAALRGIDGLCLLGEFPFFAARLANPKAAAAVLRVFTRLTGIAVDLRELDLHAKKTDRSLEQLLKRMREQAQKGETPTETHGDEESGTFEFDVSEEDEDEGTEPASRVADADRRGIEALFEQAKADRTKALALKAELDRLGLFKEYEDRFLDLFRRGE